MNLFYKYRREVLIFILIACLYFILRLPNLTLQPIFVDEAIYIRWAQIMKAEPTLRFISLTDGKTPLFMWLMIPLFKISGDPLFAGRFLSVIAGFFTLLGGFTLGWKYFNKQTAFWAALLIAVTPFSVFFDRMALVDSMLAAFSVWSLVFALWLISSPRLDLSMILGFILGGGLLTKTSGFSNIYMLPVGLIAFDFSKEKRLRKLIKTIFYLIFSAGTAFFIYSLLRLGPGFDSLASRNQDYIFPISRLLTNPLDPLIPHFKDLLDWFPKLFTVPVLIFIFLGIILAFIKRNKIALVIFFWMAGPLLAELLFLRTFTARYILSAVPFLLCLGGWGIAQSVEIFRPKFKWAFLVFILICLPLALKFDYLLLTNPAAAPLPEEERRGYLEDWTAGYGFPKIADYLIKEAQRETIYVGTEGSFGTLPDGLTIYLDNYFHKQSDNQKIVVLGGNAIISQTIRDAAETSPAFFVANKSRVGVSPADTELIAEYKKPIGSNSMQDSILFYRVLPAKK